MMIPSIPLVRFPEVPAGTDGTQVWLLAHFARELKQTDIYYPLEMTTPLLFPVDRLVGLDVGWQRVQSLLEQHEHEMTEHIKTEYLTAYEKAVLEASAPYLSISTISHPQLNRPLVMARSLFGFFLLGITEQSFTDWCCRWDDLTDAGKAFYVRIGAVHPDTELTLLTLRGTEPLVPLVRPENRDA